MDDEFYVNQSEMDDDYPVSRVDEAMMSTIDDIINTLSEMKKSIMLCDLRDVTSKMSRFSMLSSLLEALNNIDDSVADDVQEGLIKEAKMLTTVITTSNIDDIMPVDAPAEVDADTTDDSDDFGF